MRTTSLFVLAFAVGVLGVTATARQAGVAAPAAGQISDEEFLKGSYPATTPGLIRPVPTREVHPRYTPEALRAKLQGTVELQVVVDEEGHVARVRVTKSLDTDLGLDEQAVAAARQWTFQPARLDGKAVPVALTLVLDFRVH